MLSLQINKKISDTIKMKLNAAITYFTNQLPRMNYQYIAQNLTSGSGVTVAACKTLLKQGLCRSGIRWNDKGADIVLALRSLVKNTNR